MLGKRWLGILVRWRGSFSVPPRRRGGSVCRLLSPAPAFPGPSAATLLGAAPSLRCVSATSSASWAPGPRCSVDGEDMPSVACLTPSVTASCLAVHYLVIDPPLTSTEIKADDFSFVRLHEPAHPAPVAQTPANGAISCDPVRSREISFAEPAPHRFPRAELVASSCRNFRTATARRHTELHCTVPAGGRVWFGDRINLLVKIRCGLICRRSLFVQSRIQNPGARSQESGVRSRE
jgi:hypothetical protein